MLLQEEILKVRKIRRELKAINEQIQDKEDILQKQEKQILSQSNEIQQQGKNLIDSKKEKVGYLAQKGFLQEFANTDFYKRNTTAILNQQAIINNYIKKAFDNNLENYDKKFIISLIEKHNQLLMAFGIDKLMQLQPQAIIAFNQQNNIQSTTNNRPSLRECKTNDNDDINYFQGIAIK